MIKIRKFVGWLILLFMLMMMYCKEEKAESEIIGNINYLVRVYSVYSCSGVVIDYHWVITAAQCLGSSKTAHVGEEEEKIVASQKVIIHPDYISAIEPGTVWLAANDLALIKIAENISEIYPKIRPIQIEDKEWPQNSSMYSRRCLAAGFGDHRLEKQSSDPVHGIWFTAGHGDEACDCISPHHKPRIICLKNSSHTFCNDDFGGALVCDGKLTGILHTVYNLKNCFAKYPFGFKAYCDHNESLSISMYVCPYLDWIHENVLTTPLQPASCHSTTIFNQNNKSIIYLIILSLYIIT